MELILKIGATLLVLVFTIFASYQFGFKNGSASIRPHSYTKGQVDLILALDDKIGESKDAQYQVDASSYFTNVGDIAVYIVQKNGVNTVVIK